MIKSHHLLSLAVLIAILIQRVNSWCLKTQLADSGQINFIDWSRDGTKFVTASQSGRVVVYDARTLDQLHVYTGLGGAVNVARFSVNSDMIGIGGANPNIHVMRVSDYSIINSSIATSQLSVFQLDFCDDDDYMVSCGNTNFLNLYKISGSNIAVIDTSNDTQQKPISCKCTPFAREVVYGGDKGHGFYLRWRSSTDRFNPNNIPQVLATTVSNSFRRGIDYDQIDENFKLVGSDFNLQTWSPGNGATQINIGKNMNHVNVAKDGTYAAIVGGSGVVQIWSLVNGSIETNLSESINNNVTASALSPDSEWFITGNNFGVMNLYKRICNGCPSGTYINGSECIPCNKQIKGCYLCINSTHCKNCSNGFWLDDSSSSAHTCEPCYASISTMTGCNQCTSRTNCVSCVQGYYKDGSNKCSTCWSAMKGCIMCNASNSCLQCDFRYYLNSSNTIKCVTCTNITNCLSCNSSTYCLDCVQGYYENGSGGCTQCTKNCTNCINGSYCTQCDNGFYLASGVCALCTVKGCLSCNSTNYCFDCLESMWENSGSCSFCSPPCLECTTSATTCKSCLVGYFLSGTNCNSCTGILRGCVSCNGSTATDCTACATGFYFNVNTCSECTGVKANCAECNSTTCHICKLGFWYDSTNAVCTLCSAGCLTCTSATDCLSCQVGYYHTSPANTCTQCPVECSACESATVCRSCNPMFYYNSTNNNCTKCAISNCVTCKDATTCITCIQGFYYDSANNLCAKCSSISKCLDCYNSSYCKACELGFYLISTNASCSQCVSPCSTCDLNGCFTCELGYFLNTASPKSCSPCAKECEECVTTSNNCTRCVPGYYLDTVNDACASCENVKPGCMSCNSSTCFECNLALGYFHNATDNTCPTCSSKITNCLNCLSQTNCILCKYGYVAATSANASCVTCSSRISNCEHCLNTSDCQTCLKGYYLDANGDCQLCIDGCLSCNASNTCEICLREYVLEPNFSCKLCEDKIIGCEMCNFNPTIQCTNCITGYYLTSTTCTLCSSTLDGCSICTDSNTCLTCTSGYYHSPTNKCFLCSSNRPNCQLCDYNSGTSSVDCSSCNEGYFLNSSFQCQTCTDVGCISCSDSTTCTRCQTGFYLSSGDCVKCQNQYQGCIMCNTTNCLQCGSGFYLGGSNTCQPCSLQGCEICSQLNPTTKCLACNSQYYLTAGQTCELCKVPLPNCLTCVNSLTCQQCESGYFVSLTSKCSLCSSKYVGCSLCTPSVCLQCDSGYLLDSTTDTCQLCSTYMPGCSFCLSQTNCLSCQGGFYANENSCKRCNTITGCLQCTSATQCIFCDYGYYLLNDTCYPCNTTIENCVACASSVMCTACLGNFILSAGACAQLKGQSYPNYTDIKLITEYISDTELKHTLQSIGKKLTQTDLDWTKESKLYILDDNHKEHALTIKRFEFSPQGYSLVFYTDNPITGLGNMDSMPMIARRLLGGFNMNTKMKTKIQMTQVGVNSLFPSVHHTGTFFMKYKLSEPEFYRSVVNTKTYYYQYFGFIISIILVILYFIKSMILVPNAIDKGQIIPHILCFKMMAFVVYPLYGQYLNYCKGFVLLDFPWFDDMLSAMLTVDTDVAPQQYKIYYNNLNLPSTYLFALGVIAVITLVGYLIINCLLKNSQQWNNFRGYLYNLFVEGMVIGSFLALQGAYFNPVQSISINSLFYILAISIFVIIVLQSIYSLYKSSPQTGIPFHKIRIIMKCIGLSLAYANPLYIFMSLVFLDLCLLVIQYMLKRQKKVCPKLWLFNNILIDCALCMMMLGPYSLISVFVASACILAVLGIDIYIMVKEYQEMKMIQKVKVQQNELIKTMEAIEKERSSARAKNHQIYFKNRILQEFQSEKNNSPRQKKTTNQSQASLMNNSQSQFQTLNHHKNSNLFFQDNQQPQVQLPPKNNLSAVPINEQQQNQNFQQSKQIKQIRLPQVAQSKKRAANKTFMLRTWNKREKKEWDIQEDKKEGTFVLGDFDL